jgi:HSP20 family protein
MIRPGSPLRDFSTPLSSLHGEWNRLVGQYLPSWAPAHSDVADDDHPGGAWVPPIDVYETDDEIVVLADLAGVEPSGIDLSVDGRVLILRGEKTMDPSGQPAASHVPERRSGSFLRQITLPTDVNVDAVRADFRLGVLQVMLPKVETAKTRQIPIQPS